MSEHKKLQNNKFLFIILAVLAVGAVVLVSKQQFMAENAKKAAPATQVSEEKEEGNHASYEEPPAVGAPAKIEITESGFNPQTITVKEHQNILWVNNDTTNHIVVSEANATQKFDTGEIMPGAEIPAVSYEKPGTYTYYAKDNPAWKGTIIVEDEE